MSDKEQTKGAKRNLMIIGAVVAAAVIISGWVVMNSIGSSNTQAIAASSEVPEIPVDAVPRATGDAPINSDEFKVLNKDLDVEAAKKASKEGGAYIPDLIAGETQEVKSPEKIKAEEEKRLKESQTAAMLAGGEIPTTTVGNATAGQQPAAPVISAAALVSLAGLIDDTKPAGSVSGTTLDVSKIEVKTGGDTSHVVDKSSDCPINRNCNSSGDMILIGAGGSTFVQLEISIHTDEKSPVFGKILSSDPLLHNRPIIGEFYQNPNYTVGIKFNTIAMADGSISIDAIVIDSQTGRAALVGKVDKKYIERFGLPMLAAGSGKYAELIGQQGTQMTATNGTTMTASNIPMSQIRTAAIAEGVKSAGTTLNETAKAAKISTELPNHLGVQIRFLQDVVIKAKE